MATQDISVTIPAESRFVALTRVAAASLAADLDFTVDEIEDLRIAVDEIVTLLVEASPNGSAVELRFRVGADAIELSGSADTSSDLGEDLDDLTGQILEAVVDSYEFGPGSASLTKRRSE